MPTTWKQIFHIQKEKRREKRTWEPTIHSNKPQWTLNSPSRCRCNRCHSLCRSRWCSQWCSNRWCRSRWCHNRWCLNRWCSNSQCKWCRCIRNRCRWCKCNPPWSNLSPVKWCNQRPINSKWWCRSSSSFSKQTLTSIRLKLSSFLMLIKQMWTFTVPCQTWQLLEPLTLRSSRLISLETLRASLEWTPMLR